MADHIVVKQDAAFKPHPAGNFAMRCLDIVDMGECVAQFKNEPAYVTRKCVLVFASGERQDNGDLAIVSQEYTVSMSPKGNLRKALESWRGKPYGDDVQEVPLHKLEGQPAMVNVMHKTSQAGRAYAIVGSIGPLPKGLAAPVIEGYKRPEFFAERKARYAAELAEFYKKQHEAQETAYEGFEKVPAGLDDDQDLPF